MAQQLQHDSTKRTVEVDRTKLLDTLRDNREKHISDYKEAVSGYKDTLLKQLDIAYKKGKDELDKSINEQILKAKALTEEDISKQKDYIQLINNQNVHMPVPRSYEEEYNTAIDMMEWDVRDVVILTYAEFVCFIQDKWDWKVEFDLVSTQYKMTK